MSPLAKESKNSLKLTAQQRKYIRKHLRSKGLDFVVQELNLSQAKILAYLQDRWSEEKYQKFLAQYQAKKKRSFTSATVMPATVTLATFQQKLAQFKLFSFIKKNYLVLVFFALLILLTYANALDNEFVSDDVATILENPRIGELEQVWADFPGVLQPLFHFFIFHLFGLQAAVFRLINLFFHFGNTVNLFLLAYLLFNLPVAFLSATIFAVHPALTEAVTWISGGPYGKYSFFVTSSLLAYLLAKKNKKYYYLSLASFLLALTVSEKAAVLPLLLLLLEWLFFDLKKNWRRLVLPFVMAGSYAVIFLQRLPGRASSLSQGLPEDTHSFYNPFHQIPISITSYLALLFFPKNLTLYHSETVFFQWQYGLMLMVFLIFLLLIILAYKKNRSLFFALALFLVALLPVLTPFKIAWLIAERYQYLASMGVIMAVVYLLLNLAERLPRWLTKKSLQVKTETFDYFIYGFFSVVIFIFMIRSIVRNRDWQNQDVLWLATAKVSPSSAQNHNNLGDYYGRQGDLARAVQEFQTAIQLRPGYANAYHNLANIYHKLGEDGLAISNYQQAVEFDPGLWQSYRSLAAIYYEQGNLEQARVHLLKVLEVNPNDQMIQEALLKIEQNSQAE